MKFISKVTSLLTLVTVLSSCGGTTPPPSSSSQVTPTPPSSSSQVSQTAQSIIEFNFADAVYDENNQPLTNLNRDIQVTKKYKLAFTMQVIQSHISRVPETGIDSTLKMKFSSQDLFELNKNRLTGQIGGSTSLTCSSQAGSNEIVCRFTLTRSPIDTSQLFFEIVAASRQNTQVTQPVTLEVTTLSPNFIYRIGNSQGYTAIKTWYFTLVKTDYILTPPELQFSQEFGQVKVYLPVGVGVLSLYGYKPNTDPVQLLIDKTNIPFLPSDENIIVNLFEIYVLSVNGNVVFARNNPIRFTFVYETNEDYKESRVDVTIDYNSFVGN
jgi:hypothetical protein